MHRALSLTASLLLAASLSACDLGFDDDGFNRETADAPIFEDPGEPTDEEGLAPAPPDYEAKPGTRQRRRTRERRPARRRAREAPAPTFVATPGGGVRAPGSRPQTRVERRRRERRLRGDDEIRVLTPSDARRGNAEALALQRELERAKDVVRAVIRLVSRSDPSVCTEFFTLEYVEQVTRLEGDAAIEKCKLDIERSSGRLRITAFGPSSIEGGRVAYITFNLRAGERLTSEDYVLVLGDDGRWRVDDAL